MENQNKKESTQIKADNPHALPFFMLVHFTYLIILVFFKNSLNPFLKGILILALVFLANYLTNTSFSWTMVGIQLKFDKNKPFPFVSISSRSLPFVASTVNSNAFWLTLLISTIALFLYSIINLITQEKAYGAILFVSFLVNLVNLHFYIKGHNEAKDEADAATRSMLLDATVAFQTVEKNLSDEDDDEIARKIEEQQQNSHSLHRTASSPLDQSSQKIQVPAQFAGKPISQQNNITIEQKVNEQPQHEEKSVPEIKDQPIIEKPKELEEKKETEASTETQSNSPDFDVSFQPQFDKEEKSNVESESKFGDFNAFNASFPSFSESSNEKKNLFENSSNDAPLFGAVGDKPLFGLSFDAAENENENENENEEEDDGFIDDDKSSSDGFVSF